MHGKSTAMSMSTSDPADARSLPLMVCDRPEQSAAAALATVSHHHGLPVRPGEIGPLLGGFAITELGDLVVASRLLGFESVPLEGSYDDLPELVLPSVLVLRRGQGQDGHLFAVLYEVDATSALVGDPLAGKVRRVPREELCALWTGDCVQLVPGPEGLDAAKERLALHRSAWKRLAAVLRFGPPRAPKILFLTGTVALAALAATGVLGLSRPASAEIDLPVSIAVAALAVAAVASWWLTLFQRSCARCGQARALTGSLPLDRGGTMLYTVLLGLLVAAPPTPLTAYSLFAASGAHLWLLVLLARARLVCRPCALTALSAFAATALLAAATGAKLGVGIALFVAGLGAIAVAARLSRRAAAHAGLWHARRVALAALQRDGAPAGAVRVVVWKRKSCPSCLLYEASIKPALLAEFGDAIAIEEHDAGRLDVPVPLLLVAAPVPVLFVGLPSTEDACDPIRLAIESAREPALASLAPLGGIHIVQAAAQAP